MPLLTTKSSPQKKN